MQLPTFGKERSYDTCMHICVNAKRKRENEREKEKETERERERERVVLQRVGKA